MILWLIKKYSGVKPVVIDGILYVLIAMFGSLIAAFTSDESYKYCNVYFIFWTKTISEIGLAGVSALKMFRSTSYSDHLATKQLAEQSSTKTPSQTVTQTKEIVNAKLEDKQVGL